MRLHPKRDGNPRRFFLVLLLFSLLALGGVILLAAREDPESLPLLLGILLVDLFLMGGLLYWLMGFPQRLFYEVTTPRTKVRGFSGFPPKAPSGPRKTLTPYRQASAMLLALPRVFVWSFTHRTTRWNPLLQVSRSTGNFVPKNIVPNPCPPVVDVGESMYPRFGQPVSRVSVS